MADQAVVRSSRPITLLGGGAPRVEDLEAALSYAPTLVAADGAANFAECAGYVPDWVIGDLDSLSRAMLDGVPENRIVEVAEQDSTDFEKCLTRIEAPLVLATGVTAARIDHALATLSVLVRFAQRRVVVLDEHDVIFAAPSEITLNLRPGTRVSLFPFAPVNGRSQGLQWPIDAIDFSPTGRIGTSNRANGPVRLSFDAPGMLIILPREVLDVALAALAD